VNCQIIIVVLNIKVVSIVAAVAAVDCLTWSLIASNTAAVMPWLAANNTCCTAAATADAMLQLHAAMMLPPPLDECSPALPVSFNHYHQLIVALHL